MRRVEGQARGVIKMVEEGRECEEVILQLAAIREAVNNTGIRIISVNLLDCIRQDAGEGDSAERAIELFMKFSC
jgi:DNA-binding FrmR family transcriptional regulator